MTNAKTENLRRVAELADNAALFVNFTFRYKRTHQSHGPYNRRSWAEWWRYLKLGDCTIVTSGGLPEATFLQVTSDHAAAQCDLLRD